MNLAHPSSTENASKWVKKPEKAKIDPKLDHTIEFGISYFHTTTGTGQQYNKSRGTYRKFVHRKSIFIYLCRFIVL